MRLIGLYFKFKRDFDRSHTTLPDNKTSSGMPVCCHPLVISRLRHFSLRLRLLSLSLICSFPIQSRRDHVKQNQGTAQPSLNLRFKEEADTADKPGHQQQCIYCVVLLVFTYVCKQPNQQKNPHDGESSQKMCRTDVTRVTAV